jgi:hypothetical protein
MGGELGLFNLNGNVLMRHKGCGAATRKFTPAPARGLPAPTMPQHRLCRVRLIGVALSFQALATSAYGMSVVWPNRSSAPSVDGLVATAAPNLSTTVADEIGPGADDAWQGKACCLSIARSDPDPQAHDDYLDMPMMFSRITETDPILVTAEFASADANHTAHILGVEPLAAQQLREESEIIPLTRSSQAQTVAMVVVVAAMSALLAMRYRMRRQRRRWRRLAARRRAQSR